MLFIVLDKNNIEYLTNFSCMKKGCVLIQSCDKYACFWHGFFHYFNIYWDKKIDWDIYLCNEEINVNFNIQTIKQIKTGKGSSYKILKDSLDVLSEYENVFYMLEDFWMTNYMTKDLFDILFGIFKQNNCDSLRVCTYDPKYYKTKKTNIKLNNNWILEYEKNSDWLFSQQAGFWNREFMQKCLIEPDISDSQMSTSLPFEIACDKNIKNKLDHPKIFHYHYYWYPISGVAWRGQISEIGKEMIEGMNIDKKMIKIYEG